MGILSDDCSDVVWQCDAEQADLLLMETNFSGEEENSQDISSRCDIAIEVRRKRPECRIYLLCETGHPEKLPALEKAAELELIDGYYIGNLTAQQMPCMAQRNRRDNENGGRRITEHETIFE